MQLADAVAVEPPAELFRVDLADGAGHSSSKLL